MIFKPARSFAVCAAVVLMGSLSSAGTATADAECGDGAACYWQQPFMEGDTFVRLNLSSGECAREVDALSAWNNTSRKLTFYKREGCRGPLLTLRPGAAENDFPQKARSFRVG